MAFSTDKTRQGAAGVSTGFEIPYSCRWEVGDSAYLQRTPSSGGNSRIWTYSTWVKITRIHSGCQPFLYASHQSDGSDYTRIGLISSNRLFFNQLDNSASFSIAHKTVAYLRDFGAWYHIVVAVDTTQADEENRAKLYINGVQQELLGGGDLIYPSLNLDTYHNDTSYDVNVGAGNDGGSPDLFGSMYQAESHFIDGAQLTPTSFGETGDYGEWKAKKVTGLTYGTNGFYLDYADSAALGNDVSGNNNDFAVTNLVASDQMLDTPTNNFATFNPLNPRSSLTVAYSEGNTGIIATSGYLSSNITMASTVGSGTGSYHEICWVAKSGTTGGAWVGNELSHTAAGIGDYTVYWGDGSVFSYGAADGSDTCTVPAQGDIIGVAIDDTNLKFYLNNSLETTLAHGVSGEEVYGGAIAYASNTLVLNAGQDSSFAGAKTAQGNQDANGYGDFYYTPPSGYVALCTANLPEPAVIPSEHFNTVLWTGNHSNPRSFTGVGFQPDFVVSKARTIGWSHSTFDSVRGGNKQVYTNHTGAEDSDSSDGYIDTFDSDGITIANTAAYVVFNYSATAYANWFWKANGTGSSNEEGSINTTATSANVDAGFSISTYTGNVTAGATIGHGLSKAPEMVIVKQRDAIRDWAVYHSSNTALPRTDYLKLNEDEATIDSLGLWNDTSPSATLVTIGDSTKVNEDTGTYVMYCFHSVDGYSKVGSYEGNGAADGTFVYTGFRPAFVLTKSVDSTSDWLVFDNERLGYNEDNDAIGWNLSDDATTTTTYLDLLSNGFKCRIATDPNVAESYIYLAFAETPFKYSNAR